MAVAVGTQTRVQYILPYNFQIKGLTSVYYQNKLSNRAKLKLKVYDLYKNEGFTMTQIAKVYGVHKSTISRWIRQVEKAKRIRRYQYLEPKSKRPKHIVRKRAIDSEIKKKILEIRGKYRCGKDKIAKYLDRDYDIQISATTIHKFLYNLSPKEDPKLHNKMRRCKYTKRKLIRYKEVAGRIEKRAFKHFQIDTKYWVINGRTFYVIAAIDIATRMAFARAYSVHTANSAKDFLERLDYVFNIKNNDVYIQRDNGTEFMGEFEQLAQKYQITLLTNYVRRPQMNGYIERLNRSIKEECLEYYMPSTVREANDYLHEYLIVYNFDRLHDTLNGLTPFEKACELKFNCSFTQLLHSNYDLLHMYRTYTYPSILLYIYV